MYKILLADEEGVALEALRVMIDNDYGEDCDIRLAVNVQQMHEIFTKFLPDIAIINIQMAGFHGIPTLRELHTRQLKCLFIIVSYHKKTDFGREGLNLGIHSYLTKPIRHDRIKPLLKKYFNMLDAESKRSDMEKFQKEQWDQVIPMMEHGLISELLFPDITDRNLSVYLALLNIKMEYYWTISTKYSQINEHGTMCNPIGSLVQLSSQELYFRKIVKAFFPGALIGPILGNHVMILIPCKDPHFTEEEDHIRQKRCADMTYQLHKKLQIYFRCDISEPQRFTELEENIPDLPDADEEAETFSAEETQSGAIPAEESQTEELSERSTPDHDQTPDEKEENASVNEDDDIIVIPG